MHRSNSQWVKVMAATAALALTLTACGSDDGGDDKKDDSAASNEKFTNDQCANDQTSANALRVGGILPLTGNLAYLGPPEIAGVGLAVSDINAAGGVNGSKACHDIKDSGDSTDMSVSSSTADALISAKPSVVIGAAASSVTKNVVDTFTAAKVVEISPANTAVDLSGYSDYYFRTAPPDGIQGSALGTLIASDGYQKLAFLVFNDTYGTGLRNAISKTFTEPAARSSTARRARSSRLVRPRSPPRSRPR